MNKKDALEFPKITDFADLDTVPAHLLDFADSQLIDVKADPRALISITVSIDKLMSQYPRIMKQIEMLWGTQELQDKFTRWLLTDQEGRKGWPTEVQDALLAISNHHSETFGLEGNPFWGGKKDRW